MFHSSQRVLASWRGNLAFLITQLSLEEFEETSIQGTVEDGAVNLNKIEHPIDGYPMEAEHSSPWDELAFSLPLISQETTKCQELGTIKINNKSSIHGLPSQSTWLIGKCCGVMLYTEAIC